MKIFVAFLLLIISGCASIEGTRDKSFTLDRHAMKRNCETIAILPIKDTAVLPGLSAQIELALYRNIASILGPTKVIQPKTFAKNLADHQLIEKFGQWRAGYEGAGLLDQRPLNDLAVAGGADFFLLVNSVSLAREKIRAVDTGYTGMVSDANNVWRTDLKFTGELIDTKTGDVVWKGLGYAENINSPRRDLNLFLAIQQQRNPEVIQIINEMVGVATNGFINQMVNSKPIAATAGSRMVKSRAN